jgi:hypothetical protein
MGTCGKNWKARQAIRQIRDDILRRHAKGQDINWISAELRLCPSLVQKVIEADINKDKRAQYTV